MRNIILSLFFTSTLFVSCKGDSTVISYQGGTISEKEVNERVKAQLFSLQKKMYQTKVQAARNIAWERIKQFEEKRAGKSFESVKSEFLAKNFRLCMYMSLSMCLCLSV